MEGKYHGILLYLNSIIFQTLPPLPLENCSSGQEYVINSLHLGSNRPLQDKPDTLHLDVIANDREKLEDEEKSLEEVLGFKDELTGKKRLHKSSNRSK